MAKLIDLSKSNIVEMCSRHKPMHLKLGYIAHFEWMDEQDKKGNKQKQCKICGRFFYRSEY